MMHGQLLAYAFFKPLQGFMVLAVRAMSITAATINHVLLAAFFALVERSAVIISAAVDDGIDDLSMSAGHAMAKAADILRSIGG